jgi:general secretion pathway protein I
LWRPANPEGRGIDGFTLIEALAALAVMGAGLAAIGALANSSVRAGLYAERHLAEIETARKIIAGMPSREALPAGDTLWTPQRIEVSIQSPSGAILKIDTIRLRRQATK